MVIIANLGFPFPAAASIKLLVKYNLCPKGIFRRKIFFFLLLICKKTASSKKELKYDLIEKCRIHFTHGRKNKYVCSKPCDKNDHVTLYLISNVSKSLRV